jgi:deoxyribonuclease V
MTHHRMHWPPGVSPWPTNAEELVAVQDQLARVMGGPWRTPSEIGRVAACFVCFERGGTGPGDAGDRGWAGACLIRAEGEPHTSVVRGMAEAQYEPGFLALREGRLLEAALRSLPAAPDLLVVNATGRDHPRRAGLALQLGARLEIPSIGVTNRPLLATGALPEDRRSATSPLWIGDEIVASWVRTRSGTRPLVAHPGWRTNPDQAVELLLRMTTRWRTPQPLRIARQAARLARATSGGAQDRPGGSSCPVQPRIR